MYISTVYNFPAIFVYFNISVIYVSDLFLSSIYFCILHTKLNV